MFEFIPEFKEEFKINDVVKFSYYTLDKILTLDYTPKYEEYKLYFIYCSISTLFIAKKINEY